jgi:hypothetical protein
MRYFAACLAAGLGLALAITAGFGQNAQQVRMKSCNAEAASKQLTGGSRKAFMSACLSGQTAAGPALNSQQQKMKDCSATAGQQKLTGTARKTFMSSCLRASP